MERIIPPLDLAVGSTPSSGFVECSAHPTAIAAITTPPLCITKCLTSSCMPWDLHLFRLGLYCGCHSRWVFLVFELTRGPGLPITKIKSFRSCSLVSARLWWLALPGLQCFVDCSSQLFPADFCASAWSCLFNKVQCYCTCILPHPDYVTHCVECSFILCRSFKSIGLKTTKFRENKQMKNKLFGLFSKLKTYIFLRECYSLF